MNEVHFITDTATLCVFDIASLRHRIGDECDWWTVPEDEMNEVNDGNVAFIGLGSDGKFELEIVEALDGREDCGLFLHCPSGRVFLGAGEEVTGGGLEPEMVRGGTFLEVRPGWYRLAIRRKSAQAISVCLKPVASIGVKNQFGQPLRI